MHGTRETFVPERVSIYIQELKKERRKKWKKLERIEFFMHVWMQDLLRSNDWERTFWGMEIKVGKWMNEFGNF